MLKALDSMRDKELTVLFGPGGDRDRDKRAKWVCSLKFAKDICNE